MLRAPSKRLFKLGCHETLKSTGTGVSCLGWKWRVSLLPRATDLKLARDIDRVGCIKGGPIVHEPLRWLRLTM